MQSASAARATRTIRVAIGSAATLTGEISVPDPTHGLVIVAHGGAANRSGTAAQRLADALYQRGLATLQIDLLTEREEELDERTGKLRFDMTLLSNRIVAICSRVQGEPDVSGLPVGLFATHTAAGAALVAVTQQPQGFTAVVAYRGRPDLAGSALGRVMIPTLFIVGNGDEQAQQLTRHTIERMHNGAHLEVVANESGLFGELAAVDQVVRMSAEWFGHRLVC